MEDDDVDNTWVFNKDHRDAKKLFINQPMHVKQSGMELVEEDYGHLTWAKKSLKLIYKVGASA